MAICTDVQMLGNYVTITCYGGSRGGGNAKEEEEVVLLPSPNNGGKAQKSETRCLDRGLRLIFSPLANVIDRVAPGQWK